MDKQKQNMKHGRTYNRADKVHVSVRPEEWFGMLDEWKFLNSILQVFDLYHTLYQA